ncbi:hypothetical protein [Leifsonia sp. TF02-11]|uniref:hypothetical protein n=1 Tax=Leifsonia sp. TF02-11 TaxID=2815212 RepID=UPI001AA16158|nr:hypothetical protein [Leifsonia sp. TF02-11]MBN9630910.1 hypothetical protein [Actinomycetota bacterium]MBO1739639.1 hypothetical protein [Leifsonia sp. TF02-11]
MGDRVERARAWRGVGIGVVCALLAMVATAALVFLIPTEGENPRAWGIIVCGVVTAIVCARLARRNWRRLRHYRADDLPPAHDPRVEVPHRTPHLVHRQPLHH